MRIGFDLDGVLYDFGRAVHHYLSIARTDLAKELRDKVGDHLGPDHSGPYPDPEEWNWYESQLGLTHGEFVALVNEGIDAGVILWHGEPRRGARQAIDRIRDAGHTIVFVTARFAGSPGQAQKLTERWLRTFGLYEPDYGDELHFSADKTGFDLDWMIEDNAENANSLSAAGVRTAIFLQPWNVQETIMGALPVVSLEQYADLALKWGNEPQPALPWIALCGYKRSGKDTVADILVERYGYTKVSFAEPLKEMALAIDPAIPGDDYQVYDLSYLVGRFGWEEAKDRYPEIRRFLQRLGTDGIRNHLGEDIWVDIAEDIAVKVGGPVVFTDTRFPNEAEMVARHGGKVWRIERPGYEADGHASESALDEWDYDAVVKNAGDLDLLGLLIEEQMIETTQGVLR